MVSYTLRNVTIQVTKLDLFHGLQIVSIIDAHRRSGAVTIHAPFVQQGQLGTTAGWQCCGAVYVLLLRISYLPAVREHLACWEAVYTWGMNSRAAVRATLKTRTPGTVATGNAAAGAAAAAAGTASAEVLLPQALLLRQA